MRDRDVLDEVIPVYDVLRDVLDCIPKEERVSVAEGGFAIPFVELDLVDRVAEREVVRVLVGRKGAEAVSARTPAARQKRT